jgi:ABC-type transport system involved in multi-copper enzyme maturation permease subunit
MTALLWKDWRLVRPLLVAALALYLTPALIVGVVSLFDPVGRPQFGGSWTSLVASLCMAGSFAALLATPMYSAVMFARERRERTAELAATLPVSRARIVLSKAVVSIIAAAAPWVALAAVAGALLLIGGREAARDFGASSDAREALAFYLVPLGVCTMALGLGWFFSSFLRSETLAAGLAFIITIAVPATIALILNRLDLAAQLGARPYSLTTFPLGLAAFAAGAIIALRRTSP